jgi:prophage regulatory protein
MIQFQTTALLTISDVMRLTGYKSRSTIYRLMNSGNCPKPVMIGGDRIRWRSGDIEDWLNNLPSK